MWCETEDAYREKERVQGGRGGGGVAGASILGRWARDVSSTVELTANLNTHTIWTTPGDTHRNF
jgi:hypothetical protein